MIVHLLALVAVSPPSHPALCSHMLGELNQIMQVRVRYGCERNGQAIVSLGHKCTWDDFAFIVTKFSDRWGATPLARRTEAVQILATSIQSHPGNAGVDYVEWACASHLRSQAAIVAWVSFRSDTRAGQTAHTLLHPDAQSAFVHDVLYVRSVFGATEPH